MTARLALGLLAFSLGELEPEAVEPPPSEAATGEVATEEVATEPAPIPEALRLNLLLEASSATFEVLHAGVPLTAPEFASLTHDADLGARLARERGGARRRGATLALTGLGLGVAGVLVATRDDGPRKTAISPVSWEGRARARDEAGWILGLTGVTALAVSPLPAGFVRERQRRLANHLDVGSARADIDRYHAQLSESLQAREEEDELDASFVVLEPLEAIPGAPPPSLRPRWHPRWPWLGAGLATSLLAAEALGVASSMRGCLATSGSMEQALWCHDMNHLGGYAGLGLLGAGGVMIGISLWMGP
jgi:hypothetical protein